MMAWGVSIRLTGSAAGRSDESRCGNGEPPDPKQPDTQFATPILTACATDLGDRLVHLERRDDRDVVAVLTPVIDRQSMGVQQHLSEVSARKRCDRLCSAGALAGWL